MFERGAWRWGVGVLAFAGTMAPGGNAQVEHLWTHQGQVLGLAPRNVSFVSDGGLIATNVEGGGGVVSLFASTATQLAPLVWEDRTWVGARAGVVRAGGALVFELCAQPVDGLASSFRPQFACFQVNRPRAMWSANFSSFSSSAASIMLGLHTSASGDRAVGWWFDSSSAQTRWVALDGAGRTVAEGFLLTVMAPFTSAATTDARRLFLSTQGGIRVIDTSSGELLSTLWGHSSPGRALACSGDGQLMVASNFNGGLDLFRSPAGGMLALSAFLAVPSGQGPMRAAISADKRTLAVGFTGIYEQRQQVVRIYDLSNSGFPILHQHSLTAGGSYATLIMDAAITADGECVVIATSGDQTGALPELLFYERGANGAYAHSSHDFAGSVHDIEIAPSGTVLAVARSANHLSISTSRGIVEVFDLGGDLALTGVARVDSVVTLDHQSQAGRACVLLRSDTLAAAPEPYRGLGTLYLSAPARAGTVVAGADDVARYAVTLPSALWSVGTTHYYQAVTLGGQLTRTWVPVTIVP